MNLCETLRKLYDSIENEALSTAKEATLTELRQSNISSDDILVHIMSCEVCQKHAGDMRKKEVTTKISIFFTLIQEFAKTSDQKNFLGLNVFGWWIYLNELEFERQKAL